MTYPKEFFDKFTNDEVFKFEWYLQYGCGTPEDNYRDGDVFGTFECSELEAFVIAEHKNIELWGTSHLRDSFESPMVKYRKVK